MEYQRDPRGLYGEFGFTEPNDPSRWIKEFGPAA